jgi:chemotaxis response regulator CheB
MLEFNGKPVRVLLADDTAIIRRAVSRLEEEPRVKLLGEAESFCQAVLLAMTLKPDVLLLDLRMPDGGECEPAFVESQLQLSGARVLGMSLSSGEDEVSRVRAESLGAVALLDKAQFGHELIPAILRLGAASKAADPSPTSERLPRRGFAGCGGL